MTKGQAHVQTGKAVKSRVKVDPHFRTLRALAQDVRLGLWIHVCALLKHLSSLLPRIIPAVEVHRAVLCLANSLLAGLFALAKA